MKKLVYTLLIIIGISTYFTSCSDTLVYDQYAHTPIAGWEKNDTLSFEVAPMTNKGYYKEEVGLRINGAYPFMGLTLIVYQTIYPNQEKGKEKIEKVDTVQCHLMDQNGHSKGQGISYYQYNFPINIYQLDEGDSIHIAIRHDMKREILPGISDIGLKIQRITK